MDIDVPLRELGAIDTTALRESILGQEESAWHEEEYRQQTYHHHSQTQSIVLLFTDGSKWPETNVRQEPGWNRLADVALPVMQEIIKTHYPTGGEVIRAMAARLSAGGKIKSHCDVHESFHCGHRIHVPIISPLYTSAYSCDL